MDAGFVPHPFFDFTIRIIRDYIFDQQPKATA
jgi:hypothetical protein